MIFVDKEIEIPFDVEIVDNSTKLNNEILGNESQNSNDLEIIEILDDDDDVQPNCNPLNIAMTIDLTDETEENMTNSSSTVIKQISVKQLKLEQFLLDHEFEENGVCIYPYCGLKVDSTIESVKKHFKKQHNIEFVVNENQEKDDVMPFSKKNWMPIFLNKMHFFKLLIQFSTVNKSSIIFYEHFKKLLNPYEWHFDIKVEN